MLAAWTKDRNIDRSSLVFSAERLPSAYDYNIWRNELPHFPWSIIEAKAREEGVAEDVILRKFWADMSRRFRNKKVCDSDSLFF